MPTLEPDLDNASVGNVEFDKAIASYAEAILFFSRPDG